MRLARERSNNGMQADAGCARAADARRRGCRKSQFTGFVERWPIINSIAYKREIRSIITFRGFFYRLVSHDEGE